MASIKKSKIDLKKPRYILPIIFLPFLAFFSHIYKSFAGNNKVENPMTQSDELNSSLPSASKEVDDNALKSKLASMQSNYGRNTDLTAIQDFERNHKEGDTVDLSSYSYEERAQIMQNLHLDSLKRASQQTQSKGLALAQKLQNPNNLNDKVDFKSQMEDFDKIGTDDTELKQQLNELFGDKKRVGEQTQKDTDNSENSLQDIQDNQINVFREQMRIMDSMNLATPPAQQKNGTGQKVASKQFIPTKNKELNHINSNMTKSVGFNAADNSNAQNSTSINYNSNSENPESLARLKGNMFNTVYAGQKNATIGIPAIIDMDAKAIASSRIRLKVLQSFKAGKYTVERGTYVYAFVTGFGTQRVMLDISNILQNNHSIPVKLSLYDNDGYIGLYVPGSVFREFTKDVGNQSTQGLSSITMSEEQSTNLTKPLIAALFQSSSKAVSDMIRKSKVRFKYNYIVYLSEEEAE